MKKGFIKGLEESRISEFARAWKNDEFVIFLQPQIYSTNREIVGFESLVRWNHPTKGIVGPGMFMDIVEALEVSKEFDYMIFDKVCQILYKRMKEGKQMFTISCNFAREHFLQDDFVEVLDKIRRKYNISSRYLAIELLEGKKFEDESKAQDTINHLNRTGYKVYLDDCGADSFCMDDLLFGNISHVKIDKRIVDNIEHSEMQDMLESLCSLAHAFNRTIVCEGVETLRQMELVRRCGADIIQGYYYYKPMAAAKAIAIFDITI